MHVREQLILNFGPRSLSRMYCERCDEETLRVRGGLQGESGRAAKSVIPPKSVLNFQAPDRRFAVNKVLEIEVPHQTRLLYKGDLDAARRFRTVRPPCR